MAASLMATTLIAATPIATTERAQGTRVDQAEAEATAREGYDQMAEVYANHVALEMTVPNITRCTLDAFAHKVRKLGPGSVADVGCGSGHVTAYLAKLGLDIFGVDNSYRSPAPAIRRFASKPGNSPRSRLKRVRCWRLSRNTR